MRSHRTVKLAALLILVITVLLTAQYRDQLGIQEIPVETLQKKYELPESRYVSINGTSIHYCDQGSGPVIIALHGIADSLHTWDAWTEKMIAKYRIIRMDLPGFGLTGPATGGAYSREMYMDFLFTFMNALEIDRCILVGNSLGGAIAWNFALQYPQMVELLIMLDPAGYPLDIPWPLSLVQTPVIRYATQWVSPRWVFRMSLNQVLYNSALVSDEMVDRFYELSLRPGNRRALVRIMESLNKLNHDPAFSRSITGLSVPTLLLWGEQDKWIPVSHVARWQQDVRGIRTIIYDKTGHVPQMEIPDRVAGDIKHWISACSVERQNQQRQMSWMWPVSLLGILLCLYFISKFILE